MEAMPWRARTTKICAAPGRRKRGRETRRAATAKRAAEGPIAWTEKVRRAIPEPGPKRALLFTAVAGVTLGALLAWQHWKPGRIRKSGPQGWSGCDFDVTPGSSPLLQVIFLCEGTEKGSMRRGETHRNSHIGNNGSRKTVLLPWFFRPHRGFQIPSARPIFGCNSKTLFVRWAPRGAIVGQTHPILNETDQSWGVQARRLGSRG